MTVLVIWIVLALAAWWLCGARPVVAERAPERATTARPVAMRSARRRLFRPRCRTAPAGLPLTEDDLIVFGLALEASSDVLGSLSDRAGEHAVDHLTEAQERPTASA